jgi:NADP-dependent 3-hydroxy acid dehydrogenase YdfG
MTTPSIRERSRTFLVTGASSGIGFETARQLAARADTVHVLARRAERMERLYNEGDVHVHAVDVSDEAAVRSLADELPDLDAVIHCAGGARGRGPITDGQTDEWEWMWRTNVLGTLFLLRTLVPSMKARGQGQVVVVTSVAAFEALDGSAGYSTTKHAQSAITTTLRGELLGSGVRVTEICPGLVDTEFFHARFPDDPGQASQMFNGLTPLAPRDVASSILHALDQPAHVNVDRIVLRPSAQGSHGRFARS